MFTQVSLLKIKMTSKVFLYLAILCGISSQRINATFSEEGESSAIHVRQKRVLYINHDNPEVQINEIPSIVHIRKNNRAHCPGTILSRHVVLTVGHTVMHDTIANYKIYSGHESRNYGQVHNLTSRMIYHGIALLTVNPSFVFNENRRPIQLYDHPLPENVHGTVYGWGANTGIPSQYHENLRAINVPILTYRQCINRYRGQIRIGEDNICTFDPAGLKKCGSGDYGAPLVYMNRLVAIFFWREGGVTTNNPDVYINLLIPHMRAHINGFTQRVERQH